MLEEHCAEASIKPEVTVILPFHQAEDTIEAALNSVIDQTVSDWELILVDDGSGDGGPSIVEGYAADDSRIKVIRQENAGVSAARNEGLKHAQGKWVIFLDADDKLAFDCIETLLSVSCECDMVCAGYDGIGGCKDDGLVQEWEALSLLRMIINPASYSDIDRATTNFNELFDRTVWGKLYRKEIIGEGVVFVQGMKFAEDALFNVAFLQRAARIKTVNKVVYKYERSKTSVTRQFSAKDVHFLAIFAKKCVDWFEAMEMEFGPTVAEADTQHFIGDEFMRSFRRAVRHSRDYRAAADEFDRLVGSSEIIRNSLSAYRRLGWAGSLVNGAYVRLILSGKTVWALRIEKLVVKINEIVMFVAKRGGR